MPAAFAASASPTFGSSSSSSSCGSSLSGQKPAFGGFGSSPSQSSPFGSTFQQSQPAFRSHLFGSSTPFGASSQSAFGATSTAAFGSSSTPAFGATTTPSFGATTTLAFGSATTPAFGSTSTSIFGSTGTAFGASSTPAFGSTVTAAFGAPSTSLFGSSSTPAFGASSTPTFGSSSVPAFGASIEEVLQTEEAQPHETYHPTKSEALDAVSGKAMMFDKGLNPAQPQEAVPAPKPGTPSASSSLAPVLDLDEGLSPAMLTLPRFSRIAEASSFQTLTKQVVAWAHLKGDVDAIKTMLQEEPVPTDHVEELLRNMISEEIVSGYCFKDFRDSVSQILNEIKRQESVNLDSVVEELTTAKSKQLSNLRQSVNGYKFLMRGYDKEVASEISLKAELVKNRGEIRTRMNTLEQELEQARNAFAKNEAQIHKQDEAISKARACVDSVSQEIQKAEEECSQVEESLDKVGEEAEAKMRKQLEGLQASKAVLLKFDMPQCLPKTY